MPIVIHTVLLGLIAMLFNVYHLSTIVKSCCNIGSMHFIELHLMNVMYHQLHTYLDCTLGALMQDHLYRLQIKVGVK